MRFYKKISMILAALAAVAAMAPGLASAHDLFGGSNSGDSSQDGGFRSRIANIRDAIENRDDADADTNTEVDASAHFDAHAEASNGLKIGHFRQMGQFTGEMFFSGTVTAVANDGFTFTAKNGGTYTVNTTDAQLFHFLKETIINSDIKVGDHVFVTGTNADGTITANSVFDTPAGQRPAVAKGKVTAVANDGSSFTVQTKNGSEVTVNTNSNTEVTQNGDTAATSDIEVGSKVRVFGLWDTIAHLFSALKIWIK